MINYFNISYIYFSYNRTYSRSDNHCCT